MAKLFPERLNHGLIAPPTVGLLWAQTQSEHFWIFAPPKASVPGFFFVVSRKAPGNLRCLQPFLLFWDWLSISGQHQIILIGPVSDIGSPQLRPCNLLPSSSTHSSCNITQRGSMFSSSKSRFYLQPLIILGSEVPLTFLLFTSDPSLSLVPTLMGKASFFLRANFHVFSRFIQCGFLVQIYFFR